MGLITQIKWWRRKSPNVTTNRTESMDPLYGSTKYYPISTPKSPFRLVLPKPGGGYYTQNEAFVELKKPIYGPNGDKPFAEILPSQTPSVGSPTLQVSNFKKIDPLNLPTEPGNYILRKLWDADRGTYMYTNALPLESALYWQYMNMEEYKHESLPNFYTIPNPDYVNNESVRQAEREEYERILKETFKLFGLYIFPSLPHNETLIPTLIADTALQIAVWNKSNPLIPDPNWVRPTQAEIELAKQNGTPIQTTAPLVTSWTEANRWTRSTIPDAYLNHWEVLEDGVWKKIEPTPTYWLASETGGWKNIWIEVPNNENSSRWDAKVINSILLVPPKYTYDQRLKMLLGL